MSNFITRTIASQHLKMDWNVSYIEGTADYPILYLLHGATGNHTDFYQYTQLDRFINKFNYQGSIVFVDGFNSFYLDHHLKMESALVKELFPTMETQLKHNQKRVIAGISMGGFGALRLALKYPHFFEQCFAISPAIWFDPCDSLLTDWFLFKTSSGTFNQALWNKEHPINYLQETKTKFLIINNKQDEITPYQDSVQFYEKSKQILDIELIIEDEGAHNWLYWNQHIPKILTTIKENNFMQ